MDDNDIRYSGLAKTGYEPPIGGAKPLLPGYLSSEVASSYANISNLRDQLRILIGDISITIDVMEDELSSTALVVMADDTRLQQAKATEWPASLGTPKNYITYRYYRALEHRETSAAQYIRQQFEEASRDVTGGTTIDLVPLLNQVRDEAFLIQEFLDKHVGNVDDPSEFRAIELFQDWAESASAHARRFRSIFEKRDETHKLPASEVESSSPQEAREAQALFKVKLNSLNTGLASNLAYFKKNFSKYSKTFYDNFFGPALQFRLKVSRNIYPTQGRIGEEVNTASEALNSNLSVILADQVRRNSIFDAKLNEIQLQIDERDTYRSYIKQLAIKGRPLPVGARGTIISGQDSAKEVEFFTSPSAEYLQGATPFVSPHDFLSGREANGHPQYLLRDKGQIIGDIEVSEFIRIDGVDLDEHAHTGADGTHTISGTDIGQGTLPIEAVDQTPPPTPTRIRVISQTSRILPGGASLMEAVIAWDGELTNTHEIQNVTI